MPRWAVERQQDRAIALNPTRCRTWAPYVRQTSENLGAPVSLPISAQLRVLDAGGFTCEGRAVLGSENTAARSAVALLNLRAGLEDANGKWTVPAP